MVTSLTRQRLRQLAVVVVAAAALGALFNLATTEPTAGAAAQGAIDGALVGALVGAWQLFVREGWLRAWYARHSFLANLAVNGSALALLFLLARALGNGLTGGSAGLVESFTNEHLLVAFPYFVVLAFAFSFGIQMSRMIGTNVLGYFVAGTYHRPRLENRVFLFLDLVGSTALAERLGNARYYALLRRCVDDLTEPILETRGQVYQYAGDEVVVTWRLERAVADANCLRCFFAIEDVMRENAERYRADFGEVPRFRAGLHGGEVIAGEIGDLKQEIVFVGDILNTAARLEEYAKRAEAGLVASGSLVSQLQLPEGVHCSFLEELALRGKEEKIEVYALSRPSSHERDKKGQDSLEGRWTSE